MRRSGLTWIVGTWLCACSSTSSNSVTDHQVNGGAAGEPPSAASTDSGGAGGSGGRGGDSSSGGGGDSAGAAGGDGSGGVSGGGSGGDGADGSGGDAGVGGAAGSPDNVGGASGGTEGSTDTSMGGATTETSAGGAATSDGSGGTSTTSMGGGGGTTSGTTSTVDGTSTTGSTGPRLTVITSASGDYWNTDSSISDSSAAANVTVDDNAQAQPWDGFGAAFTEVGWSYLTSAAMKNAAIRLLFSDTDGANFAWGRIPIGANDYAISRYTLDDTGPDVEPEGETNRPPADLALDNFSIERDRDYLLPYIQAALDENPNLRFWASPWTPPVWMKTGYKTNSGADTSQPALRPSFFDGGNMRSDSATLSAYADYIAQFIDEYEAEGIDIEIVAPQSDPGWDQNYPSCLWEADTYTTFIADYLGPQLEDRGVSVMLGTLSNDNTDLNIASEVLADADAKSFLSSIGASWTVLDASLLGDLDTGLPIWGAQHKAGNYPWSPSGFPAYEIVPPNDYAYAVESWGYIRDAIETVGVTSYNAWHMVLDEGGLGNDTTRAWAQNTLLVADAGEVKPTPTYYVFRHFSQYVQPGATVVDTSGGDAVAFKNPDDSIVVVLYNDGAADPNYVVWIAGESYEFAMPADGWATVKYEP